LTLQLRKELAALEKPPGIFFLDGDAPVAPAQDEDPIGLAARRDPVPARTLQ
jgi:hypothetical protein